MSCSPHINVAANLAFHLVTLSTVRFKFHEHVGCVTVHLHPKVFSHTSIEEFSGYCTLSCKAFIRSSKRHCADESPRSKSYKRLGLHVPWGPETTMYLKTQAFLQNDKAPDERPSSCESFLRQSTRSRFPTVDHGHPSQGLIRLQLP